MSPGRSRTSSASHHGQEQAPLNRCSVRVERRRAPAAAAGVVSCRRRMRSPLLGDHRPVRLERRTVGMTFNGEALPHDQVSESVAELNEILRSEQSREMMLDDLVNLAHERIPVAASVSVALIEDDRPVTVAWTGRLARDLDEWQYREREGPSLTAAVCDEVIGVGDLPPELRWPRFALSATGHGVLSSLAIPLPGVPHLAGALNLYGSAAESFGAEEVGLARAFAAHVALAVLPRLPRPTSDRLAAELLRV